MQSSSFPSSSLTNLVQEKLKYYQPNLTPQEIEKAKSELNEHTSEVRNHAVCSLARSLEHSCSQQFLSQFLPQISEPVFLLRFLRASKFRPEKSLSRLIKWLKFYSKFEPSWPELSHVLNNPESSGLIDFMKSYNQVYVCPSAGKKVPGRLGQFDGTIFSSHGIPIKSNGMGRELDGFFQNLHPTNNKMYILLHAYVSFGATLHVDRRSMCVVFTNYLVYTSSGTIK